MEFAQAQSKDIGELTNFIREEKGLEIDYIQDNIGNFYLGSEDGKIAVCGGYIKTLFPKAKEIRGVVTRPKNGIRTKQMNNFLCDIIMNQYNTAVYAVINQEKECMKKYIQFLKRVNNFKEVRVPSINTVMLENRKPYALAYG